ncbi:SigE family RNA polymerase sigma factor [Uniformispora flossi]|uniref:SigE family RNA polymerase sigma factor n=1 Tax=Uniformispora flossi TaxID=3390723 RepID=UPI003C2E7EC1
MEDPAGFHDYVAVNRDRLVRFGWLLCGSRTSAEDLVQEALVRVWLRWERVGRGSVDAYVHKVMVSTHLTRRRRLWRREEPTDLLSGKPVPGERQAPDPMALWDSRDALAAALRRLPPRQRAVLVLRFFLDLSEADTAAAMSCTRGTVKSQTYKALRTLRGYADELRDGDRLGVRHGD